MCKCIIISLDVFQIIIRLILFEKKNLSPYYMRYGVTINGIISEISNREWFSKNDLYVVIKYNNQIRRTSVMWNCNEPVWNEGFIFDVNIEDDEPLIITINDEDLYSKGETLIKEELPINFNKEKQEFTKHLSITHGILNYELMDKNIELSRKLENNEIENAKIKKKITDLNIAINNIGEFQQKCHNIINKK